MLRKLSERKKLADTSKSAASKKGKSQSSKDASGGAQSKKAKAEPKKQVKRRKVNAEPTTADKTGLNISVARVKSIIDKGFLNRDVVSALDELTRVPSSLKEEKEKGLPTWSQMSQATKDVVAMAAEHYYDGLRQEYEKSVLDKMTAAQKSAYSASRKKEKSLHEKKEQASFTDDTDAGFDLVAFNKKHSKKFYDGFKKKLPALLPAVKRESPTKKVLKKKTGKDGKVSEVSEEVYVPLSTSPELKRYADLVSKLKVRFSANVKILLASFVEMVVHQLAVNGIYSCINDKKKIIKVRNIVDLKYDGVESRLPLQSLVSNLNTYKEFVASEAARAKAVKDGKKYEEPSYKSNHSCNFHIYIVEIFRDVRLKMSSGSIDVGKTTKELKEKFALTSLSQELKVFCSRIIIELLERIAMMLDNEVTAHGVKTVTTQMVRTVIKHMHYVCGVDYAPSRAFMQSTSSKYVSYIDERRVKTSQ